jgi:hypothetical protein
MQKEKNDNESNGKRKNSVASGKKRKVEDVESQSTKKQKLDDVVSLKTILSIPDLSRTITNVVGGDVRPLNEQRNPALFIRISCDFEEVNYCDSTEHLIKIQWSCKPNSYIISTNITDPTPSAYTRNEPLEKIILDILSLKQQMAEIQLKESDETDFGYFNINVNFVFSELLPEKMQPSAKEEISRRLEVLTHHSNPLRIAFDYYDHVTFADGRRKQYTRTERYKEGNFLQHELEFSRRIFSAMHYCEMKYYDGCTNNNVDIEPMVRNIVITFKELMDGGIRLLPQELPPSMWEEKKVSYV